MNGRVDKSGDKGKMKGTDFFINDGKLFIRTMCSLFIDFISK
jgi:hypothetical protein